MSQPAGTVTLTNSSLNILWLLHIAIEAPVAVQGLFMTLRLPFIEMSNTTIVVLKLYSSLMLSLCAVCLLVYNLPDYLPGKRALAILLLLYHGAASTVLLQAPRFIPHSFGPHAEGAHVTPESVWGVAHGMLALLVSAWWQYTLGITKAMGSKKTQ